MNRLFGLLIIVLTFISWQILPQLFIRADGFVYLLERIQRTYWNGAYAISGFETGAVFFGWLFAKLFGPNIELYLWMELIFILLISVLFYIFVYVLTKKTIVAFSAALIASSSYFGNWDMLGTRCYCFFLERVIVVPLLVTSLIFLHLYLEKNTLKYYFFSLSLYFLGVGLAHFSVLFTTPFLLYPLFFRFFKRAAIIGITYLLLSVFFVLIQQINESGLRPDWGFFEFLLNPQRFSYLTNMSLQLIYWSQYAPLLQNIDAPNPFANLTLENATSIIPVVILVYVIAAVIIYIRLSKQRAMLKTIIIGVVTIFYLNAYFHLYDVAQPDSNRYMYFPTFLLSIFWAYFLWAVFYKSRNKFFTFAGIIVVALYYVTNSWLIWAKAQAITTSERGKIVIFNKLRSLNDLLNEGTIVVGSYPELLPQEAEFFSEQLGRGRVLYLSEGSPNWQGVASSAKEVLMLTYDKNCRCVKEALRKTSKRSY